MDTAADSYRRFCEEGDESGLADIIRMHKDGLTLYLNSFVGNYATAEELAEDTFVLIGTKKPRDKRIGSFKTWLYTIGRHRAIDYLRRHARQREIPLEEEPFLGIEIENIETMYIRQEERVLVHRALIQLKPDYRQALWLIYYEGFTHKQVAAVMKKREHAVAMLVSRAKNALKAQLEAEGFVYENS